LTHLGEMACAQGNRQESAAFLSESLALAREHGDAWVTSWILFDLGYLALSQGEHDRAWGHLQESLRLQRDVGDVLIASLCLDGLGWIAVAQEKFEQAARLLAAAEGVRGRVGGQLWPQYEPDHERAVGATRAALGDARFTAVCQEVRALSMEQAFAEALLS
jgi:tetratricopeptide (TPR) repeat protein